MDSAGNVYIADTNNHRIRKVSPTVAITTMAGDGTAGFAGDGGLATAARLRFPTAVAVDGAGNVFIADTGNHCIRQITGTTISTVVGNSTPGFAGDNGPATGARLDHPAGVAVTSDGATLYVADTGSNRVRRILGGTITNFAGNGLAGFGGDGGAATLASLHAPRGLALDAGGNLFIADSDNERVRRVKVSDSTITTVAGVGSAGNSGDGGGATNAALDTPSALASHAASGIVYVVDSGNLRVRRLAPTQSNNAAPVIAAIQPSALNIGQTLDVPLSATDADGDAAAFSLPSNAPAFLSIINANPPARTATLRLAPACPSVGTHSAQVQASDGKTTVTSASFNVTVSDPLNSCGGGSGSEALVINSVTPALGKRGQTIQVTISGGGFEPGADVTFTGGGITVTNVSLTSTRVVINAKISAVASITKRSVTVKNLNSVSSTVNQVFQILQ